PEPFLVQAIELVESPSVVPVPASSATEWFVPVLTVIAPVVSPLPASVAFVVPSIWRLNLPGSLVGERVLRTSIEPVLRVLVIVQTTSSSSVTVTSNGPEPLPAAATEPAPVPARQSAVAV